jgi:PAS domain S-box-containing protein
MTYESSTSFQVSEQCVTGIFEALPASCILLRNDAPRYTIVAASPEYLAQTGTTKEGLIGKGIFEAFPPNPVDPTDTGTNDVRASLDHVRIHKEPHRLPVQRYDVPGEGGSFSEKYWSASNKPVFAPDGRVAFIIHTAEDITALIKSENREVVHQELQQAYKKMEGSEAALKQFKFIADQASDPFILMREDGTFAYLNKKALEAWGYTEEEAKAIRVPDVDPIYQHKPFSEAFAKAQVEEIPTFETLHKRKDGHIYPVEVTMGGLTIDGKPHMFAVARNITERKQNEEALRISEAKYRTLFESMDQGYCVLEMIYDETTEAVDYRFLEGNPVFEKQPGLKDAIHKTARQLVPNLEDHWIKTYGKVARTGEALRFTEESKAMGRWFDVYAFKIGNQESQQVAVLFTDITEKKRAEEALRISEERQSFLLKLSDRLRSLVDAGEIQLEAACLLGQHFGANRVGYAEDTGDGETIVVTRNYTSGVPGIEGRYKYDEYGPGLLQEFRAGNTVVRNTIADNPTLTEAEKAAHVMLQIGSSINVPLLRNGRLLGVMFVHCAAAHSWTDQEVALIQETADRTWEAVERARTETALRNSEDRFRTMVNAVPQSIWITDAEGRAEFLNEHWCNYCGEPFSETTATEISVKHLHPEDAPKVMQAFSKAMQTGEPWEIEQRNRSKDGEYRWFLNRATPYRDPATGKITKWFGVGIDIHDRKLAEQALRKSEEELEKKVQERTRELEKANEELRRSNQNLEEFAYAASHDMKEPIRKIHFFADRLKERLSSKLEEEDRRYFERLEMGSKRMSSLIDDLLLYSHVSRGVRLDETVDLNQTLAFVLDDLELHMEEKCARIEVGPLPTIKGQQRQLQQLFENLLANALKYSKPEMAPEVTITSGLVNGKEMAVHHSGIERERCYHLIEVKDNGIGFNQEDADRIFNVFTRLHGNSEYKGTGVGLSIARKVVQNHGGYIWAESTPGEGAIFKILLPA